MLIDVFYFPLDWDLDEVLLLALPKKGGVGPGAALTPTGIMPVGDAVSRDTWLGAARQSQGEGG